MKTGLGTFSVRSLAVRTTIAACALLAIYLFFRYILGAILPFVIAFSVASFISRGAERISKATGLSSRLLSTFMLVLCLSILFSAVFLISARILREGEQLLARLSEGEILSDLMLRSQGGGHSPFISEASVSELLQKLTEQLDGVILSVLPPLISAVTGPIISIFSNIPRLIIFVSVTVISCFYFCLDYKKIRHFLLSRLPGGALSGIVRMKKRALSAVGRYLRAQAILLSLTLSLLFVGFLLLGVRLPFITACIVSLVDLLPVLGVGTVLIPWGLLEIMLRGDFFFGIGLMLLYVTVLIVRQIAEPRIVGRRLGIHPLAALTAMYVGYRIFGPWGALLAPLIASVTVSLFFARIDKRPTL